MKPHRDPMYLEHVRMTGRALGCCICEDTSNIHAHHEPRFLSEHADTAYTGGMGEKASDYTAVPMCSRCHGELHAGVLDHRFDGDLCYLERRIMKSRQVCLMTFLAAFRGE